jgi:hypothetical protein
MCGHSSTEWPRQVRLSVCTITKNALSASVSTIRAGEQGGRPPRLCGSPRIYAGEGALYRSFEKHFRRGRGGERELQIPFDFAQGRLSASSDFLSGLLVPVNLMRLSSKNAAYIVVDESSVVGNPEFDGMTKERAALTSAAGTEGWTERRRLSAIFTRLDGPQGHDSSAKES